MEYTGIIRWLLSKHNELQDNQHEVVEFAEKRWPQIAYWRKDKEPSVDWQPKLVLALLQADENEINEVNQWIRNVIERGREQNASAKEDPLSVLLNTKSEREIGDGYKKWLNESRVILKNSYDFLKENVQQHWPNEPDLLKQSKWPNQLIMKCLRGGDADRVESFINNCQEKLDKRNAQQSLDQVLESSQEWLNMNDDIFENQKDAVMSAIDEIWPGKLK
uniref:uncharacterized protein LOC120326080 n=1 Tax=Styela clava TaxID=7725 RepID=UPI001939ED66|nr:uncharacterized protein LOC120326080 [Styela clava]